MFQIFNGQVRGLGENPQQAIYAKISVDFRKHLCEFKGAKLAVFINIMLHADTDGWSEPTITLLEKETGYDGATISRALTDLCEMQIDESRVLLAIQERNKGTFVRNRYLLFPSEQEVTAHQEVVRKPRAANDTEPHLPNTAEPNTVNATLGINHIEEGPSSGRSESPDHNDLPDSSLSPVANAKVTGADSTPSKAMDDPKPEPPSIPGKIDPTPQTLPSRQDQVIPGGVSQSNYETGKSKLTPPEGYSIAYSRDGYIAHLFKSDAKQPSVCMACHEKLGTWSNGQDNHVYAPCCDWGKVKPKEAVPERIDPLVEWVAVNLFQNDVQVVLESKKMLKFAFTLVGVIVRAEKRLLNVKVLSQEQRQHLAGELVAFLAWYADQCKGCTPPQDVVKFEKWLNQWYKAGKPQGGKGGSVLGIKPGDGYILDPYFDQHK